jgi:hypothetical protein
MTPRCVPEGVKYGTPLLNSNWPATAGEASVAELSVGLVKVLFVSVSVSVVPTNTEPELGLDVAPEG